MSMRFNAPPAVIETLLNRQLQRLNLAIVHTLQVVGEKALNAARQTNSYRDQTGNLRSSLGYVVVCDGKVVAVSGFAVVKNGKEGTKEGAAYAKRLAKHYSTGYALIVVAGMNYAAHVSAKGYDVLDSAELIAYREVPRMLKRLKLS